MEELLLLSQTASQLATVLIFGGFILWGMYCR